MTPFRSRTITSTLALSVLIGVLAVGEVGLAGATPVGPAVPKTTPAPTAATVAPKKAATVKKTTVKKSAAAKKSTSKTATASKSASAASSNTGPAAIGKNSGGFGQGSRGDKVLALQTRLQELKYDVSEPDGQFGVQTYHAVMAFQKVSGIARTGRANDATLAALKTATDPAPLVPNGGPDRVEIDIPNQYLALYVGGSLYKILSVSTGSGKDFCVVDPDTQKSECDVALTPGGSFRIQSRIIGWRESKLGLLYNPLYFNGGIAIHGAPSVPNYPASHGCVRIPMVSAEWFYEEAPDGIPVYVYGGKQAPVPLGAKAPTGSQSTPTTTKAPAPATTGIVGTVPGATTPGTAAPDTTAPVPTAPGATAAPSPTAPATPGATAPIAGGLTQTTTATTVVAPTTSTTGLIRLLPPAS